MQETSQHIKDRMLKNAARVWHYKEKEPESNFDPVLSILLNACSVELEKISSEIQSSRSRILQRLVQLLSPEAFTAALPAHAIASAQPVEDNHQLSIDDQLYLSQRTVDPAKPGEQLTKDIFFSPAIPLPLKNCAVKFMATGNSLFRANNDGSKELLEQTQPNNALPGSSLWLGIDEPTVHLQNSLFYFGCRSEADKTLFYQHLPTAKWYWSDQQMSHLPGYGNNFLLTDGPDLENILSREDDANERHRRHISAYYQSYFITLTDERNLSGTADNTALASIIDETFTGRGATQLKKQKLRWICVDFQKNISSKLLEEVTCIMNCFPVYNRMLHETTPYLKELVNIIPLPTDDIFLELDTVVSDENEVLSSRSYSSKNQHNAGVLLRFGGVGRFDERDASTMVNYLVQLLRDERAAFSELGSDFISNELQQLEQIMNKLEQRLSAKQVVREQSPYLIVKNNPDKPWQNIHIRYWSTSGAEGNNCWPGSYLNMYSGAGLKSNQAVLITPTVGGKNKLTPAESVGAYKSALLSKDRLVTTEDIKIFCRHKLVNRVKTITVENGVIIHPSEEKGYVKIIRVAIGLHKSAYDKMLAGDELNFWKDDLKLSIEQKSAMLFPYQIEIYPAE